MLILTRSKGQAILIDDDIVIRVVGANEHAGVVHFMIKTSGSAHTKIQMNKRKPKQIKDETT